VQIEKIGEGVEIAERVGKSGEGVVTEVQHAETLEAADPRRQFGETVVGKNEGLEVVLFPHPFGNGAEALLPKVEVAGSGHC